MIKIDNNLSRDNKSKAVLSTNKNKLESHRQKIKQSDDINSLREDVNNLTILVKELIKKVS